MNGDAADLQRLGLDGARLAYLRAVLALLRPVRGALRALGVDVEQLALLLRLRLALSLRVTRAERDVGGSFGLWIAALGLLVFGVLVGVVVAALPSAFWAQSVVQTAVLYLVTIGMLLESSALFGDRAEDALVLPTPVDGRTLLAARLAYIGVTLVTMVGCLTAAPLVLGAIEHGGLVWLAGTLVASAGSATLATCAVLVLYLLALRTLGPSRFRGAIAWAQLGVLASVYVLVYVLPPMLRGRLPDDALELRAAWMLCVPPFWYGGLQEGLAGEAGGALSWWLASVGLVVPLALVVGGITLARGGFLEAMSASSAGGAVPVRRTWPQRLARQHARPGPERAGFLLFAGLASRESGYRMRVVPMYLILCAMGVGSVLRDGAEPIWSSFAFYALLLGLPVVLTQARFSENHEAAWIASGDPRALVLGVRKAAWVGAILLPAFALLPVVIALAGLAVVPHAAFALAWTLAVSLAFQRLPARTPPFARRFERRAGTEALGGYLLTVVVIIGLGSAQSLVAEREHGLPLGAALGGLVALALGYRRPDAE